MIYRNIPALPMSLPSCFYNPGAIFHDVTFRFKIFLFKRIVPAHNRHRMIRVRSTVRRVAECTGTVIQISPAIVVIHDRNRTKPQDCFFYLRYFVVDEIRIFQLCICTELLILRKRRQIFIRPCIRRILLRFCPGPLANAKRSLTDYHRLNGNHIPLQGYLYPPSVRLRGSVHLL